MSFLTQRIFNQTTNYMEPKSMNNWTLEISSDMSDDQIRQLALNSNYTNCFYLEQICRKCGDVKMSPDGKTENAKIVRCCKECFDE